MRVLLHLVRVVVPVFLLGCAPVEDGRQGFLVEQLRLDNLRWLSRDPELLRAKYARMAEDPYDFMRAMATVGVVDWTRPGGPRLPTSFLTVAGTETTLLAGDPHPENIGAHRPDGPVMTMEVNDLDGATYGPYVWDVRRGMLGLAVLLEEGGCVDGCLLAALEGYAGAYTETIGSGGAGVQSGYGPDTPAPVVLADLLDNARADGDSGSVLRDETEVVGSERRLIVDGARDEDGRGDLRLTPNERAQVERLTASLNLRVLDGVRRYGRGVASLPAIRYVLLVDEGDDGLEDDRLLQMREVIDPLPFAGWRPDLDGGFSDNAERIVRTSRSLWSRPDADPALAGIRDGASSFKVQTLSGYFEGFEHRRIQARIRAGRFDPPTLLEWSRWLGAQLATVHLRAPSLDQPSAGPPIAADLAGREAAFVEERLDDALRALADNRRDATLFRSALERLGPDLGAR